MKKSKLLILLCFIAQTTAAFPGLYKFSPFPLPPCEIANLLGWVPTCTNLCGGYYNEPAIILACPNPTDLDAAPTTITAEQTVSFSATGTSQLEGNVTVTQPGRKMTAQKATLYRNPKTNKIAQIHLEGDVHYYESGKQLVAQTVFVDLEKKYVRLGEALYRLARPTRREVLNAWGVAESAERISNSQIILKNASYTTCSPVNTTWVVTANRIHIDRDRGRGDAKNTYLFIKDIPVVWVPYFSFPVDKRRKTGFLFPTIGYANGDGMAIGLPYYLNLAPNYDATLIPKYIYRRGVGLDTQFRYLTCNSVGSLNLELIPYDAKFAYFRRTAAEVYGITPATIPFLNRINNSSNSRGSLIFLDSTQWNPHLWGSLGLNYVTDDYYLQDFAYNPFNSNNDQLLNQAEIHYASDCWRFLGRAQVYQTLHPINQTPILNQYTRLPQLYIESNYPDLPYRLNLQFNSEFVYFDHSRNFFSDGEPITTGQRFHLQPSISYPIISPATFFIPKLQLDATLYNLQDRPDQKPSHINRVLPIFDIDTGIYLERPWQRYTQTLEPRLFYLFIPKKNQNDIPLFDTTLPSFSFPQLFRTNRFIGYDRLGDANQISLALTTRFLNSYNGTQKFRASIGQIYYFQRPTVCLTPDCRNDFQAKKNVSPFVGEMSYNFSPAWDAIASAAVDPDAGALNNASIQFHYRPDIKHIFNVGYDFVRKGDTLQAYALNSSKSDLNRINFALGWQLNDHWQALASWNYNLSHSHPEAYFYGFQYDSCCWAIRIIASRILTAENITSEHINDKPTFQTNFYVQLQLKGLGNIGNSDPGNLLTSSIFGYQDNFRG